MVFTLDLKSPVEVKRVTRVVRVETVEASSIGKALRFETGNPLPDREVLIPFRRIVGMYGDQE